jgi:hypothetical protein
MTEVKEWSGETLEFMQLFQAAIEESALQVYSSAIEFSPPTSRIFYRYYGIIPIPNISEKGVPVRVKLQPSSSTVTIPPLIGRWLPGSQLEGLLVLQSSDIFLIHYF